MASRINPEPTADFTKRIEELNWDRLGRELDESGFAVTPQLLRAEECAALAATWNDERLFRKRVDMGRQRFGLGEYKYFAAPVPEPIRELRAAFYRRLAPIANQWRTLLRWPESRFPNDLDSFLGHCHSLGQTRPTPLVLRYEASGYNCLHQDLYGDAVFPLQITFVLSRPGIDYRGGEFLLVENQPRAQARGTAVELGQGEAVIFPSVMRPGRGRRGYLRLRMRHGVSTLHSGTPEPRNHLPRRSITPKDRRDCE